MQDKQTDSYWSIMTHKAEAGSLSGTDLQVLPVSQKMSWKDWKAAHPDTLVLSIDGRQDPKDNRYAGYFADENGFRGAQARDKRLPTKAPVYAFLNDGKPFAVDHARFGGGKAFPLPSGGQVFLFRRASDEMFRGTNAFYSAEGFAREHGKWTDRATGAVFDKRTREFAGRTARINGFDTFWYNWSLNHPGTALLR